MAGDWNQVISKIPSNPGHFVISRFYFDLIFPHGWAATTFGKISSHIKTDEFRLDTVETF